MTQLPPPNSPLSKREMEILRLLSEGSTNLDIADRLGLSLSTVKAHNQRIFARLGARDRAHAVRLGFEGGLLAAAS